MLSLVLATTSWRPLHVHKVSASSGAEITGLFGPLNGARSVTDVRCHFDGLANASSPAVKWAVSLLLDAVNVTCGVPRLPIEAFWTRVAPQANFTLSYVRADNQGQTSDRPAATHTLHGRRDKLVVDFVLPFNSTARAQAVVPNVLHMVHLGGAPFPVWACLSLLTAALVWNPAKVVLHVDQTLPADDALACAQKLAVLDLHATPPVRTTDLGSARVLPFAQLQPAQRSDIVRLDVLLQHGGIFLETDALVLGPHHGLRQHDFSMAFNRAPTPQLDNGMLFSAPRAPFAALLRRTFEEWRGSPWPQLAHELPFRLATQHPDLINVVNFPEARWPNGRKRPGHLAVASYSTVVERGRVREAYRNVSVLHLPTLARSFSRKAMERGDLLYALVNALANMADAPDRIHALAANKSPGDALCASVLFVTKQLLAMGHEVPARADMPAKFSAHFPAGLPDCAAAVATLKPVEEP